MQPSEQTFGPYYLTRLLAARDATELTLTALFIGSVQHTLALRLSRPCADGANDNFLRQARRYAILHHPNIVEVRDLGSIDGRSYVATDYVKGYSLLRVLGRCGQQRLGFPTDVALYIVDRLLHALEYAHALMDPSGDTIEVLHGDVCHSNVLLTPQGRVRLSDFGMKIASTRRRTPRGTHIGGGKGFCCYSSPEQIRAERADTKSDLFAVGIILYELVTGRLLLTSDAEEPLLDQVAEGAYLVPLERYRPDLNPMLDEIIRTALAPSPCDRFASAREFREAIGELLRRVGAHLDKTYLAALMQRLFGKDGAEVEEPS